MDGLFGAIGSIASASIASGAQEDALNAQLGAIQAQRAYLYANLDPTKIGEAAQTQDEQRAQAQLALQGKIDPTLLQQRYAAESAMGTKLADLINAQSPSAQVASAATADALKNVPGSQDIQNKLIDAALKDISAGATLPPDLQAEMVQSGLQSTGQATGVSRATGIGGTVLRTVLGSAGIQLQQQRQAQAAQLAGQAQQLETQRQSVLQQLFPNLQQQQIGQLGAAGGVFSTSQGAVPQAGISGQDVANIWLARVGASNQLTAQAGNAAAQSAMNQGTIWSNALGGAARGIGGGLQASGWFTPSSPSDVQSAADAQAASSIASGLVDASSVVGI